MLNEKIELSSTCIISSEGSEYWKDLCIQYTEHSQDHYHSDSETEISITREKARNIVKLFAEHFKERCLTDDEADAIARLI